MKAKLLLFFFFPVCLFAQYFETPYPLLPYFDEAPAISSRSAVLIDAETGALLYSKNSSEEIPPASITKLMTMHLVMKEIKEGRASYDEIIPITVESWAQSQPRQSSLMFLEPGQIVTLREILLGLAVSSGNDAAVAAALRLAPSMEEFAEKMTLEARRMGLNVTRFEDASGYSDQNITTAEEFAYFCYQYIRLHPNSMKDFHSVVEYSYPTAENIPEGYRRRISTITQPNRNTLLSKFEGADGLKTGFIPASGNSIALTAARDNTRFILMLMGAPSGRRGAYIRETDSINLLSWAFKNFKTVHFNVGQLDDVKLWKGKEKFIKLKLDGNKLKIKNKELEINNPKEICFTSFADRSDSLSYEIILNGELKAPLPADHPVGYLVISDNIGEVHRVTLVTDKEYERGNVFKRIWDSIVLLFKKR
ncbi:MAG: D-alanyl-D-alanine carboxypeptidase [Treponema sp.]|nr:D-alanyl-D-alanine carboxypeptidase [Treponema sp.]